MQGINQWLTSKFEQISIPAYTEERSWNDQNCIFGIPYFCCLVWTKSAAKETYGYAAPSYLKLLVFGLSSWNVVILMLGTKNGLNNGSKAMNCKTYWTKTQLKLSKKLANDFAFDDSTVSRSLRAVGKNQKEGEGTAVWTDWKCCQAVKDTLLLFEKEVLPRPAYSLSIAFCGHNLFRSMQHGMAGTQLHKHEEVRKWVDYWIAAIPIPFDTVAPSCWKDEKEDSLTKIY